MSEFSFTGRTLVKNLQKQFKKEFGGTLRVYNGKKFADPDASLASIRKGGKSKKVDFKVKGNMQVGTFENKMLDEYGIRVQVANKNDTKLVDNKLTLSKCGNE